MTTIVISGPQGSGKTQKAKMIASNISEDWAVSYYRYPVDEMPLFDGDTLIVEEVPFSSMVRIIQNQIDKICVKPLKNLIIITQDPF